MLSIIYRLLRIEGDYAILIERDRPEAGETPVARALLPCDADEGSLLLGENMEFSLL